MEISPANTAGKFTVQLPEAFTCPRNTIHGGRWYLGLIEIAVPPISVGSGKWDVLYVTCPHVEGVVTGDAYSTVLRSVPLGEIRRHNHVRFQSVLYTPLRVKDVRLISIELRNSSGTVLPELALETKHSTKCTLELVWK